MNSNDENILCQALDDEMKRQSFETNDNEDSLLCQALDEEMERQQSMSGRGEQPPTVQLPIQAPAMPLPVEQATIQRAALNQTARNVTFHPTHQDDILQSMNELEHNVTDLLIRERELHQGVKWYMALTVKYFKVDAAGEQHTSDQVFRSSTVAAVNDHDIIEQLAEAMQEVYKH